MEVGREAVELYKYEYEKYNGNHFTHKWIKATRTQEQEVENAECKMQHGKWGKWGNGQGKATAWLVYCFSTMYRIV